jgi:hypothetical protein
MRGNFFLSYFLIAAIIAFSSAAFARTNPCPGFDQAIAQCRPASCNFISTETAEVAADAQQKAPQANPAGAGYGNAVRVSRQVLGMQDGKCAYKESAGSGVTVICALDGVQAAALANYYQMVDNGKSVQRGFNVNGGNLDTTVTVDGRTISDVSNQLVMNGACKVGAPPSSADFTEH